MREILFRGKGVLTGEWYESMTISKGVIKRKKDNYYFNVDIDKWVQVDAKTIGQYTGLIVGYNKIFEGDVLDVKIDDGDEIVNEKYIVVWDENGFMLNSISNRRCFVSFDLLTYNQKTLIGNIHDNAEILK